MAEGASALAARSEDRSEALVRRVASPGGTTEAGLGVLDGEPGLRQLVLRALDASRRRSAEMAEAARRPPS
jgi:pyrroline-5-carboxylate reductase